MIGSELINPSGSGDMERQDRLQDQEPIGSSAPVPERSTADEDLTTHVDNLNNSEQPPLQRYAYPPVPHFRLNDSNNFVAPYPMPPDSGGKEGKNSQSFPIIPNVDLPCPPYATPAPFPPMMMSVAYPLQNSNFPLVHNNQALPYPSFPYGEYENDPYTIPTYTSQNPMPYGSGMPYMMHSTSSMQYVRMNPRGRQGPKHNGHKFHAKDHRHREGQHAHYHGTSHHNTHTFSSRSKQTYPATNRRTQHASFSDQSGAHGVSGDLRSERPRVSRLPRRWKASNTHKKGRGGRTRGSSSSRTVAGSDPRENSVNVHRSKRDSSTARPHEPPKNDNATTSTKGNTNTPALGHGNDQVMDSGVHDREILADAIDVSPFDTDDENDESNASDVDLLALRLTNQRLESEEEYDSATNMDVDFAKKQDASPHNEAVSSTPVPVIHIFEPYSDDDLASEGVSSPTHHSDSDITTKSDGKDALPPMLAPAVPRHSPLFNAATSLSSSEACNSTYTTDPAVTPTPSQGPDVKGLQQHGSFYRASDGVCLTTHARLSEGTVKEGVERCVDKWGPNDEGCGGILQEKDDEIDDDDDDDGSDTDVELILNMEDGYDSVLPDHLVSLLDRPETRLEELSLEVSRDSSVENEQSDKETTDPDPTGLSVTLHQSMQQINTQSHEVVGSLVSSTGCKSVKTCCNAISCPCIASDDVSELGQETVISTPIVVHAKAQKDTLSTAQAHPLPPQLAAASQNETSETSDASSNVSQPQSTVHCIKCASKESAKNEADEEHATYEKSGTDMGSAQSRRSQRPPSNNRPKQGNNSQNRRYRNTKRHKADQRQSRANSLHRSFKSQQKGGRRRSQQRNQRDFRRGNHNQYIQNTTHAYSTPEYLHQPPLFPYQPPYPMHNPYVHNGVAYYPLHQQPHLNSYFGFQ